MKTRILFEETGISNRGGYACRYAGSFCISLSLLLPALAQAQDTPTPLPPVQVEAPKNRPAQKQTSTTAKPTTRRRTVRSNQPPKPAAQTASVADTGNGPNNNTSGPPLQLTPSLGKTGTKLEDLPASVQIIRREVVT